MDDTQIQALFCQFTGGDSTLAETYALVIEMAKDSVTRRLIDPAFATDSRLNFLVAALANLRYVEITAAQDRPASTFAGTIAQNTDAAQKLAFARHLAAAYGAQCRELVYDDAFVFAAVPAYFDEEEG